MGFSKEQFLCQELMDLENKKTNEIQLLDLIFPPLIPYLF